MLNLIFSLLAGAVVYGAMHIWLGVWWQALPPGILAAVGLYFYLSRRTWKQVEELIKSALSLLEPLRNRPDLAQNQERVNALVDETIKKLKEGYRFAKWQFMVRSQINSQIGIILFSIKKDTTAAMEYLQKSFQRNWVSQGMLAVAWMKKHQPEKMEETFEIAVRLNKKEDLLWNLYAYCLQKIKRQDKAIEVLGRAQKILPNNKYLIDNLVALQNNKKMKMKDYGEQWYQFNLEKPPMQKTKTPRFSRR